MRVLNTVFAIFVFLGSSLATAQPATQPPDPGQLLDQHLAARGGAERLRSIKALRLVGVQVLAPSPMELPLFIEQRLPDHFRMELTLKGMVQITTFDGKTGWILTPWAANKEPVEMTEAEAAGMHLLDFACPYLGWRDRGWKAEYMGVVEEKGRTMHQVKLAISPADDLVVGIEVGTFQEVVRELVHRHLGREMRFMSYFDDFRKVQNLVIPFSVTHLRPHGGRRFKMLLDQVDLNPTLPDARFQRP